MTDWFTDRLFQHPAAWPLVFPWSRLVCDVERLFDDSMETIFVSRQTLRPDRGANGEGER